MKPRTHFKGQYAMKTLCRRRGSTTCRPDEVTCPQCREKIARQREADKGLGNYTIQDDMVGTARITRKSEAKMLTLREALDPNEYSTFGSLDNALYVLDEVDAAIDPILNEHGLSAEVMHVRELMAHLRQLLQSMHDAS